MPEPNGAHDPYAAMRIPGFRLYWFGNIIALLGMQMQAVAVGWEVYQRTHSNRALGWVGLAQFLPVLILALPAGQLADRFNRKRIVLCALAMLVTGSLGLAAISAFQANISLMYACLLLNGVAKAVQQPAKASLMPNIVPRERFSNAVTWNSSGFQLASVLGPGLAGMLIYLYEKPSIIYLLEASSSCVFLVLLSFVYVRPQATVLQEPPWQALVAGLRFVWRTKVILSAITLDLFAVLLGGATTLLPVFAEDILGVGAKGLGWMRAAPAVGALVMAVILAHRAPLERAGLALLWAVAGFGVATIVFGISRDFWLSFAMLFLTGALDMISVVIRHTSVQMLTPDEMRGRVQAVNGMFIGASNELGGYESGEVAHWFERPDDPAFGPTVSVVSGGIGTLAVVGIVSYFSPQIRQYGRLGVEGERVEGGG